MPGFLQPMQHWLSAPWRLKRQGILGMNARNRLYVSRYNDRRLYPLVDNKLKTKQLALDNDIACPELIGVIDSQQQVAGLQARLEGLSALVIKPAKGSGGKGILVLSGRSEERPDCWYRSNGELISLADIQRHVSNILAGLYSLGGAMDVAVIEDCIRFDPYLTRFSHEGVPDVRVVVCRGYPVMAMTRLATRASDGKANLHQGAIGVGISLQDGRAVFGVMAGRQIWQHPDTGESLSDLVIPQWQTVLELAARCCDVSGLGYLGADVVLDRVRGPMLLELNARPGLSIQLANGKGLRPRLRRIDQLVASDLRLPVVERVQRSQQWFGD